MKRRPLGVTVYFTFVLLLISFGIFKSFQGPHGGTVKKAGKYNIEVKNLPAAFSTWLLDHKLKSMSNENVTCQVRFLFADSTHVDADLVKLGTDGFTTTTAFDNYSTCRVTYTAAGEKITAKFDNETILVKKQE